ncbi:MAG TPA: hypothetical protein VF055_04380 [Steroidobacteraceae bacterium]
MNYKPLRIERLTRELKDELLAEFGPEHAARMLEHAAAEIRRAGEVEPRGPFVLRSGFPPVGGVDRRPTASVRRVAEPLYDPTGERIEL